jgi:hypothetical protein
MLVLLAEPSVEVMSCLVYLQCVGALSGPLSAYSKIVPCSEWQWYHSIVEHDSLRVPRALMPLCHCERLMLLVHLKRTRLRLLPQQHLPCNGIRSN